MTTSKPTPYQVNEQLFDFKVADRHQSKQQQQAIASIDSHANMRVDSSQYSSTATDIVERAWQQVSRQKDIKQSNNEGEQTYSQMFIESLKELHRTEVENLQTKHHCEMESVRREAELRAKEKLRQAMNSLPNN